MKKKIVALTVLSFSGVFADTDDDFFNNAGLEKASEKVVACSSANSQMQSTQGQVAAPKKLHYKLYGDYLYWNAYIPDFSWYEVYNQSLGNNHEFPETAFKWSSGFRLGADFKTEWLDLVFDANWTRFYTTSSRTDVDYVSLNADVNSGYLPVGFSPSTTLETALYYAQESGHLHFNQVDISVKKSFNALDNHLTLLPFAGYRLFFFELRSDQYFVANKSDGVFNNGFPNDNVPITTKNTAFGQGLMVGLKGNINLGCRFKLFAGADGALVIGQDKAKRQEKYVIIGTSTSDNRYERTSTKFRAMADFEVGLAWDRKFRSAPCALGLKAAYEAHMIFDTPSMVFANTVVPQNLTTTLCGLTLGADLKF